MSRPRPFASLVPSVASALFVLTILIIAGCGHDWSTAQRSPQPTGTAAAGPGYQDTSSVYAGLAFATVDSSYASSAITFDDFRTGNMQVLSSGESGDPFLKWLGNRLFLFNRSTTSLNFRSTDPRASGPSWTAQTATPSAAAGDPHDALLLDAHRLLLAQYNAGKLVVIDPTSGALVQTVDAAWDIGTKPDSRFRPHAFYVHPLAGSAREIYVLHQGLDKNFKPDGSQRVFVLKDDGTTVTPVDLDPGEAGVQGIPLTIEAPAALFAGPTSDTAYIYGECTVLDPAGCRQGFETLSFSSHTSTLSWDTGALGLKGNGGIVKGAGSQFFELMVKADGDRVVEQLDGAGKTTSDLYTFKSDSGCCALYFDDSSGAVFAGDSADATTDFFAVLKPGAPEQQIPLTEAAYSGAFVPQGAGAR